jgi:methyl-accepting chemotaxis protein
LAGEVEQFLEGVTKDVEDRRKAARKAISEDVTITFGQGKKRTVQLIDVSTTGAQIMDMSELALGEKLVLDFLDGSRLQGTVVRHTGAGCGVEFADALPHDHILLAA